MTGVRAAQHFEGPRLIGGRYRVERELARGGMGTVYRVEEPSTGRCLALKQLRAPPGEERRARSLFEREYETLARIDHPRIIRVYDYGDDVDGPFYTMELLEGKDLRELAPLPYGEACRHLRDVAFSLTLLHSREYLHRDLSPRNVRLDSAGRPKLIDFGGMTRFGLQSELIGTPPCMPPEAVRGLPLDARSDLFAFGAVAYWLLTGRHAYPAGQVADLMEAWERPVPPPSTMIPGIPERLDRLVLSLLSQEPGGRPGTALEVIDTLDSIVERAPEEEREFAESYLGSSPLVGREAAVGRLREALTALSGGRGSATLIAGEPGVGRTRLLNEIRLEALLAGCTIATADAAVERGPYGMTRAIVAALIRAVPEAAPDAGRFSTALDPEFLDAPRRREGVRSPDRGQRGKGRAQLQQSIEDWLFQIAATRRLVLLIDDLQLADEPSAALFASLALRASEERVCLIATRRLHDEAPARTAIEVFEAASTRVGLSPFSLKETEILVNSLFTGDSRAGRLATWMHQATGGNPLSCMEIARHLVTHGIARYTQGVWILPRELSMEELPSDLSTALATRVGALDPPAREVAEILAVHRGPLSLDLLVKVQGTQRRDVLAAVDQLITRGVAVESEKGFRLTNEALRGALSTPLSPERRTTLHRRIGEALLDGPEPDLGVRVDAGWHLLQGGKESEGADVLAHLAPEIERLRIADAVSGLETAASVYERENRPLEEQVVLRASLATLSFAVDWRLRKYAHPTVEHLARLTGVAFAGRLQKIFGRIGFGIGIGWQGLRYSLTKSRRAPPFSRLFQRFLMTVGSLGGVAVLCLDIQELERLRSYLAPFQRFREKTLARELYGVFERFLAQAEGRDGEAFALAERAIRVVTDPTLFKGVPTDSRVRLQGSALVSFGVLNAYRADGRALAIADDLAALGDPVFELFSIRVRMLHHAFRGESKIAAEYAERMERHAMRGESVWQNEVTLPVHLITPYALTWDVVGMKRTAEQLEKVAAEIPSLALLAKATRATYLARSGRGKRAVELFEELMVDAQPRRLIGWAFMAGIYAGCLNDLGQHERAAALCRERMAHVQPGDRPFTAHYLELERQLALAEAGSGDPSAGAARLHALLQEFGGTNHPLVLGLLHQARAKVALQMADSAAFEQHFQAMRTHFSAAENPSLTVLCERLAAESIRVAPAAPGDRGLASAHETLSAFKTPRERAVRSLELLVERARATQGYLYQLTRGGLVLMATIGADGAPPELTGAIWSVVDRGGADPEDDESTALVDDAEAAALVSAASGVVSPNIFLLTRSDGSTSVVVGAVALRRDDGPIAPPSHDLLAMIAEVLVEDADVLSDDAVRLRASSGPREREA